MSKPLTILHTEASCGWGGQEIRILTEMAGMNARGHRTILLCPPEANIYREGKARGLEVHALPIGRKRLNGVGALRAWLKKHPVDVINTHSSTDSWLAALACKTLRNAPPIVRTRHISPPINNKATTRWLYQTATRFIVTTGEKLRETLICDNGYDGKRILSVTTGIDTRRFVPGDKRAARELLGLDPDAPTVGILATLRSWKGHQYLLEAFAGLADKRTRLLIVGHGPRHDAIIEQIKALGLDGRVTLPGNQDDVVPWLQAMDVFALPSYANEGVPQAMLQAMLVGLPIVTTPVGSITEAIESGQNGLIVEPQQVPPLQAALEKLLGDRAHAEALGAAARTTALARYSTEVMLDKMEGVFRGVSTHG